MDLANDITGMLLFTVSIINVTGDDKRNNQARGSTVLQHQLSKLRATATTGSDGQTEISCVCPSLCVDTNAHVPVWTLPCGYVCVCKCACGCMCVCVCPVCLSVCLYVSVSMCMAYVHVSV